MVLLATLLAISAVHRTAPTAWVVPQLGHTHVFDTPALLAVATQPNGHLVACTFGDSSVRIYDAASYKKVKVFRGHPQPCYAVAWSHDGKYIASGDDSARVFVWSLATGQRVAQFRAHQKGIENLSFNHDDTLLLSTGKDDVLMLYDLRTKKVLRKIETDGGTIYGGEFSPKVDVIATGSKESARIYSPLGVPIYTMDSHGQGAYDSDYNSAGTMLITAGSDGTCILWDPKSGKRLGTMNGHDGQVLHACLSPNGRVAATGSIDRTVRIWDVKKCHQIAQLDNQDSLGSPVRFTGDGKYLITANIGEQMESTPITPAQPASPGPEPKPTRRHHYR